VTIFFIGEIISYYI